MPASSGDRIGVDEADTAPSRGNVNATGPVRCVAAASDHPEKGQAIMSDASAPGERRSVEAAFTDMLQQLRVVQTGVQILSAFLLTLPFTQRFNEVGHSGKVLYTTSLISAVVSVALVIAPVSYRQLNLKTPLSTVVQVASRLAQAGLLTLLVAVVCSVSLAVQVAVGDQWAVGLGCAVAAVYLSAWYALPAWHRARDLRRAEPP